MFVAVTVVAFEMWRGIVCLELATFRRKYCFRISGRIAMGSGGGLIKSA